VPGGKNCRRPHIPSSGYNDGCWTSIGHWSPLNRRNISLNEWFPKGRRRVLWVDMSSREQQCWGRFLLLPLAPMPIRSKTTMRTRSSRPHRPSTLRRMPRPATAKLQCSEFPGKRGFLSGRGAYCVSPRSPGMEVVGFVQDVQDVARRSRTAGSDEPAPCSLRRLIEPRRISTWNTTHI